MSIIKKYLQFQDLTSIDTFTIDNRPESIYFNVIDLEGIANLRGSSFGALGLPVQPSTEQFENLLATKLRHFKKISAQEIWLEAESAI